MFHLRSRLDLKHIFQNIKISPRNARLRFEALGVSSINTSNFHIYKELVKNNTIQYVYITEPFNIYNPIHPLSRQKRPINRLVQIEFVSQLKASVENVLNDPIIEINKYSMFDYNLDYNINIFVNKEDMFLVEMYKGQWFP